MTVDQVPNEDPAGPYDRAMIPVIDLFAGAGGFSLAAAQSGADPVLSVEVDGTACETMRANAGHKVQEADVTTITGADLRSWASLGSDDPLVIVGGPPCQPFSKAAYWLEDGAEAQWRKDRAAGVKRERPAAPSAPRADDRRSLVEHFTRLVVEADAGGFVFENVPAVLHPRNRPIVEGLEREMREAGYETTRLKAIASSFGVAQHRERVFVLGSRTRQPDAPQPTHDGKGEGLSDLLPAVTCREAFAAINDEADDEPEIVVRGTWERHLREIPPGWNYKFHTAWAGHPTPTFEAERRFWNFLLVLDPEKPSWTIPANPGPWVGPFHWEHRRLSTPEMAVLQGFPADYRFAGSRRERVRQIGNAVPPAMASHMVRAVCETLRQVSVGTCAA
jgi:DNA (cytosine-5)-methyltransferase 1